MIGENHKSYLLCKNGNFCNETISDIPFENFPRQIIFYIFPDQRSYWKLYADKLPNKTFQHDPSAVFKVVWNEFSSFSIKKDRHEFPKPQFDRASTQPLHAESCREFPHGIYLARSIKGRLRRANLSLFPLGPHKQTSPWCIRIHAAIPHTYITRSPHA